MIIENEKNCDKCRVNPVKVSLTGIGEYCLDCYNSFMCEKMQVDFFNNYSKRIIVYENNGTGHVFCISHMILGTLVSWDAEEDNEGYKFNVSANIDGDQSKAFQKLLDKIFTGINTKSMSANEAEPLYSNTLHRGEKQYSLNDTGIMRLEEGESKEVYFIIDGIRVTPNELANMLTCYSGFNMKFEISDISDDITIQQKSSELTEEDKKNYKEQFEEVLQGCMLGSDFISYKLIPHLEREIWRYLDVLKKLIDDGWAEYAMELSSYIKKRLTEIQHDDDYFPEYELQLIDDIIHGG